MLRITTTTANETNRLKLEGKLVGPWVAECRAACAAANARSARVALDLSGVTFVDAAGLQLLGQLIRDGHVVSACSSFVAELLITEDSICRRV